VQKHYIGEMLNKSQLDCPIFW